MRPEQLQVISKRYPLFEGTPLLLARAILRRHGVVIVRASAQKISVEAFEPEI